MAAGRGVKAVVKQKERVCGMFRPDCLMLWYLPNLSIITAVCCLTVKKDEKRINKAITNKIINAMFIIVRLKLIEALNYENSFV